MKVPRGYWKSKKMCVTDQATCEQVYSLSTIKQRARLNSAQQNVKFTLFSNFCRRALRTLTKTAKNMCAN